MSKQAEEILAQFKSGKPKPIYFLMGEEAYYIDLISDFVEKNFLDESEREFNQTILYGLTTSAEELISTVKRFPMMASHQVVILKEAQMMKEFEKAEVLFSHPVDTTVLIICYKHGKLDKRKGIYKTIASTGVILESDKLKDNNVSSWIGDYCKLKGININNVAKELLATHLGSDLEKIVNSLDKLGILVAKGEEITPKHIEKNIGISKDYNIYELQNALGTKNVKKAFEIVKYIQENPKTHHPVLILGLLNGFFSKVYQYQFLTDKSKAAAELKIAPFAVYGIEKAARAYPVQKLENIFSYLREADLRSKGVNYSSNIEGSIMEELVFKILN